MGQFTGQLKTLDFFYNKHLFADPVHHPVLTCTLSSFSFLSLLLPFLILYFLELLSCIILSFVVNVLEYYVTVIQINFAMYMFPKSSVIFANLCHHIK